ncbi:MAG TPA: 30S ribosome-binding factor RbfA [Longimicrobiaceae bacterium]|nr:30S ribosome-binding factor RbfA [Longimicrobiaceae bacterium]
MPKFNRTDRINEQLKQEIAVLVRDQVRDPRVGLATVTAVECSPELDHAKVYVTTLGSDDDRAAVIEGLRSASPFIRSQLGRRLHMRRIPELHFEYDRVLQEALRIERLLREALPNGPEAGSTPIPGPEDVTSDASGDEPDVDAADADEADADGSDDSDAGSEDKHADGEAGA